MMNKMEVVLLETWMMALLIRLKSDDLDGAKEQIEDMIKRLQTSDW
jgi:hypothetical protein